MRISTQSILWWDAAYSFEKKLPSVLPNPRLIFGIVIRETSKSIFIATNVSYDPETGRVTAVDGFVIPVTTIIDRRTIDDYEH